jgi:tRNA(Glu) U13 pseudouridine synthase TruD
MLNNKKGFRMAMKLKSIPEDFIVSENIPSSEAGDKYLLCMINRKAIDHFTMLSMLSSYFRVSEKLIGFCGIKDKNAVISQHISLPGGCASRFISEREILIDDGNALLSIELMRRISTPLSLGGLESNAFDIIIREIGSEEKNAIESRLSNNNNYAFPNYFGDQRFGNEYNNARAGYSIIRKDFVRAARILGLPETINPVDSLRRTPRRLRMLMISALQSAVFNANILIDLRGRNELLSIRDFESLIELSKRRTYPREIDNIDYAYKIPIAGLGMESNEINEIIMAQIGITERDFAIRQMPDILLEPASRYAYIKTCIEHEWISNDAIRLKFTLTRGAYATILVESLTL